LLRAYSTKEKQHSAPTTSCSSREASCPTSHQGATCLIRVEIVVNKVNECTAVKNRPPRPLHQLPGSRHYLRLQTSQVRRHLECRSYTTVTDECTWPEQKSKT
jgi:hypothetical protein